MDIMDPCNLEGVPELVALSVVLGEADDVLKCLPGFLLPLRPCGHHLALSICDRLMERFTLLHSPTRWFLRHLSASAIPCFNGVSSLKTVDLSEYP